MPACRYTAQQLKAVGFSCTQLKNGGFSAKALEIVGFNASQLKGAGFRPRDIKECGLKASSVFELGELRADGFTLKELTEEGYLLKELREVFSVEELKRCACAFRATAPTHVIFVLCGAFACALRSTGHTGRMHRHTSRPQPAEDAPGSHRDSLMQMHTFTCLHGGLSPAIGLPACLVYASVYTEIEGGKHLDCKGHGFDLVSRTKGKVLKTLYSQCFNISYNHGEVRAKGKRMAECK